MSPHQQLISRKLEHLQRMRHHLAYSLDQARPIVPIACWAQLSPEQHQTLAALRIRYSEYQEHLGKTMRAIAIEEEQRTEPFSAVLLYMEKLQIIDSAQAWKELRELRNAINHEYEEDAARLASFFLELVRTAPDLMRWHQQVFDFCQRHYGCSTEP